MCGITGFINLNVANGFDSEIARQMANRIRHRGPDEEGLWADADTGIALAQRRLSILDLSSAGHQPMLSHSGRWVLTYNGEIYNHLDLRRQLEASGSAPVWRGHSDTETLLACIESWGVEAALKQSVGMFAFAVWDRNHRTLWLARDRIGEKPLYYGWQGDTFLFGSELKALRVHPSFRAEIDRGALVLLLQHNYIPVPHSIYRGIFKLPPATLLRVKQGQRDVPPKPYWALSDVAELGLATPFTGNEEEALDILEQRLGAAVRGLMVADVPLGVLLSGGIDSSLITALMQSNSARPVRTFTIGFEEKQYDEAAHARAVAAHLGAEHTELRLGANDALALIPQMPAIYDEPFADSSQLPTHLVMKLARQHVTVALSGDAGDEMFGGYNRYSLGPKLWKYLRSVPAVARASLVQGIAMMPTSFVSRLAGVGQTDDKLQKLLRSLGSVKLRDINDLYLALVSEWPRPERMVLSGHMPNNLLGDRARWPAFAPAARMMLLDGLTYLPDDILTKVDRASMAVSLETRAPFLDLHVMEFAWALPISMKLRGGKGKWLLRKLLERYVPPALVERPKMGFGIPLDQWLRGPLHDWAEALLAEDRLRREGFFEPAPIRKTWLKHQRGESSFGYRLWSVLMFQAWLEDLQRRD